MHICLLFFFFNYHPSALWNCKSGHVMSSLNLLLVLWSQNILCWCAVIVSSLLIFPYQKQQRAKATQTFSTMHPPKFTKSCIKNQFCRRDNQNRFWEALFMGYLLESIIWETASLKSAIKITDHHSTWIAVVMRIHTNDDAGWSWWMLSNLNLVSP